VVHVKPRTSLAACAAIAFLAVASGEALAASTPSAGVDEVKGRLAAQSPPDTIEGFPATYSREGSTRWGGGIYGIIRIKMPPPEFRLLVIPERPELKGSPFTLKLDDARFDTAFLAQGAPSDFARAALDEPLRAALLACPKCVVNVDGSEWINVSVGGGPTSKEDGKAMFDVATLVAKRAHDGVEPAPDTALSPEARATELEQWKKSRQAASGSIGFLLMMSVVGLGIVGVVAYGIGHRRPRRRMPSPPPAG
jgi:hypothetical protein